MPACFSGLHLHTLYFLSAFQLPPALKWDFYLEVDLDVEVATRVEVVPSKCRPMWFGFPGLAQIYNSKSRSLTPLNLTMIRRCHPLMPRVSGLLTSSRVSKRPWPFTRHVEGEKLSCQMKGRCMDGMS